MLGLPGPWRGPGSVGRMRLGWRWGRWGGLGNVSVVIVGVTHRRPKPVMAGPRVGLHPPEDRLRPATLDFGSVARQSLWEVVYQNDRVTGSRRHAAARG